MRSSSWTVVMVLASAFAAGCASNASETAAPADAASVAKPAAAVTEAIAVVDATTGDKVKGIVRFVEKADGVLVTADISGLKPKMKHAFHIHEFGDCSSGDGKSAGGHYNPEGHPHAGPDAPMHHAGDLGNLTSDAKGHAHYEQLIAGLTINGDHDPILGRSVVIHAGEDDLTSQPAGNAGDRIGCGVIGVAKPAAK